MLIRIRPFTLSLLVVTLGLIYIWRASYHTYYSSQPLADSQTADAKTYFWKTLKTWHPPQSIRPLPNNAPVQFPKVQATFREESPEERKVREARRQAVSDTFAKSWAAYRQHAWKADEVTPVTGNQKNGFGGWGATLVDSIDTLWIMGMKTEFEEAVDAAVGIDFTVTTLDEVNVFETNIRYLGGFISAYDLSGDVRLLRKAVEVGEMLYKAFDTPHRTPITRWDFHAAINGRKQDDPGRVLLAEVGSLCMEFTRLSIITRDSKWFDAVQRLEDRLEEQQDNSLLPGLWPIIVNTTDASYTGEGTFSLGGMADSTYEYLPKMSALMGGQLPSYQKMYEKAAKTAAKYILFRPMTPMNDDILVSGVAIVDNGQVRVEPQGQHLVCFFGGVMALAAKLFQNTKDMATATKLVKGCIWTYKALPHGIMPESFSMLPCPTEGCDWEDAAWKKAVLENAKNPAGRSADDIIKDERLPPGFLSIPDRRYILRPEAIESIFVLYRTTGRASLQKAAWDMFESINKATSTKLANSAVEDVTVPADTQPKPMDSMESFWLGETLKYFYLMFSTPDVISLDEFVFNTEAHPFRRLV